MTAALLTAAALAAAATPAQLHAKAVRRCNVQLRPHDGADVFSMSADQVEALADDIGATEPLLRHGFPRSSWERTRRLRLQLRRTAHLGRVYAAAYRADSGDGSLREEVAFENALRDLRSVAKHSKLPACSVRVAAP